MDPFGTITHHAPLFFLTLTGLAALDDNDAEPEAPEDFIFDPAALRSMLDS